MTFRAPHILSILLAAGIFVLGAHMLLKSAGSSTPAATGSGPVADARAAQAEQDLRAVATAASSYLLDRGAYDGMTVDALRASYDAALRNDVVVVAASGATYCLQATVEASVFSQRGPAVPVAPGAC